MSEPTNLERTVLTNSIVNNFLLNRNLQEYKDLLEEMFLNYTTTNDFACSPPEIRKADVDMYREIRDFFSELGRIKVKKTEALPEEAA